MSSTKCRAKDPRTCRVHGVTSGILQQIEDIRTSTVQPLPAGSELLLPAKRVRRGMNNPEDTSALDALDKESEDFRAAVTGEEESAVMRYAMTSYLHINPYLRGGREGIAEGFRKDEKREPTEKDIERRVEWAERDIALMDSAFAKHKRVNDEPRVLYKAFRVRMPDGAKTTAADIDAYVEANYQVGKVFENKAYTSTSADADYMLGHARRHPETIIVQEIVSRKGIPVHEKARSGSSSVQDAEREILLPRNIKLRVVNVIKATYESTYPGGRPSGSSFYAKAPAKKRYTVIQMVEEN